MLEEIPLHLLADILLRYCTAREIRMVTYCSKSWLNRLSKQDFLWKSLLLARDNNRPTTSKLRVGTFHELYMRSIRGEKLLEIETISSRNRFQLVCAANMSQFALKQKIRNIQNKLEGKSFEDFELVVEDTHQTLGVCGNDFVPARDSLDIAVAFADILGIPPNLLLLQARETTGWERTIAQLEDGVMLTQVHCKEWMRSTTWSSALHFTQAVFTKAFAVDVVLIRAILTSGLFVACFRVYRNLFTSSLERHIRPLVCKQVSPLFLIKLTFDLLFTMIGALLPVIHSALRVEAMRIVLRVMMINKDLDLTRERMYINLGWALHEALYTNAHTGRMDSIQYAASSLAFWTLSRFVNCTVFPQVLYSIPTAYCTVLVCIALENIKAQQFNFEIT